VSTLVSRGPGESERPFSRAEKLRLLAEIAVTYISVRRMMRASDLPGTIASIRASQRGHSVHDVRFANRLGAIVDGHLGHLPGDTRCLVRSLVLLRLLARRGWSGSVVIGVRSEPTFGAHAWVEMDGRALLQPIEASGQRLVEL
jgi:hypothetical protein